MQRVGRRLTDIALTIEGSSLGPLRQFQAFAEAIAISARTSKVEPLVQCINEFVGRHLSHSSCTSTFIIMAATIVLSPSMGDTFTQPVIWEGKKSRPVYGHIGGEQIINGNAWSMQEMGSSSMHIICMDLRVGAGKAMLLYATQLHRGHA